MITTRERLTLAEIVRGLSTRSDLDSLVREFVPTEGRHVLYASQGKAAFEQIVLAAGLEGSKILMPAFFPDDFVGVFLKYRITPVFVDVDPKTYHLDLGAVTAAQLSGAKALLLEHTFGLPADGAAFRTFCDQHGLLLIEDCARALGAASGGRLVGSFGHYAVFSLPKCAPVRAGGVSLAEAPFQPRLAPARIGLSGLLHALTLVRYPFAAAVEGVVYSAVADSPIYPREVGNYEPLPAREFDALGRLMLRMFLPSYGAALQAKRAGAAALKRALEPVGFTFQEDRQGEHIDTSVAADPPASCDSDALKVFLIANGVKASAMWRSALGISEFGRRTWNARPDSTPVALRLSKRLIQLPVSRFRTPAESRRIVDLCERFAADAAVPVPAHRSLSSPGHGATL
ncbi:MAG: DegT/DnrJ/EryC1/StrS family aminotransferase [Acidobacteriota bacterium]